MAPARNLAASAGAWSARNRRTAIAGWLLFVAAAYAIGMLVGQRNLTDAQMGNGESGTATSVYQAAFPYHTREEILVQGRGRTAPSDESLSAAIDDLVARLSSIPTVAEIQTPFPVPNADPNPALRAPDGRSVLVAFAISGDSNQAQKRVDAPLAAAAAVQRDHPALRVEEFGSASASKALLSAYTGDFNRAEHTSLPLTLLILLAPSVRSSPPVCPCCSGSPP